MPKRRYAVMRDYMPKKGKLGLDMMLRTCTVQVNLDFGSEADMVKKFRVGLALQPVAVALFANSPFVEGKPSGYLSYRSHVWTDTDPDRCGMLPFVFEHGFGFERYVDYMLDVPMYFVYRDGNYIDAAGQSFRDFMVGRLPALPGEMPTMSDWADHLTTAFPEVRLKRFLEMRGADGGPVGAALRAAGAVDRPALRPSSARRRRRRSSPTGPTAEREALRRDVPRLGLAAPFRGRTLARRRARGARARARRACSAARRLDSTGQDESHFLATLFEIARVGPHPGRAAARALRHALGRQRRSRSITKRPIERVCASRSPSRTSAQRVGSARAGLGRQCPTATSSARGTRHVAETSSRSRPRRGRAGEAERRPRQQRLGDDARLVGAEIERLRARRPAAQRSPRCSPAAPAQSCDAHRRLSLASARRRDEIEREAPRPGAGIDVELEAIGLAQRERAVIGEEIGVVIILADGGEGEAVLAPGEIGLAERDLAGRGAATAAAARPASANRSASGAPGSIVRLGHGETGARPAAPSGCAASWMRGKSRLAAPSAATSRS